MFTVAVADAFPTGGGNGNGDDSSETEHIFGDGTSNGYMPVNTI